LNSVLQDYCDKTIQVPFAYTPGTLVQPPLRQPTAPRGSAGHGSTVTSAGRHGPCIGTFAGTVPAPAPVRTLAQC
jgi:hypothetical protein